MSYSSTYQFGGLYLFIVGINRLIHRNHSGDFGQYSLVSSKYSRNTLVIRIQAGF